MAGIWIACALAVAVALLAVGGFLWRGATARERLALGLMLASQVPASWLVNVHVKLPLHNAISPGVPDRDLYGWLSLWYAPVTEEIAKALTVAVAALLGWLAAGARRRRAIDAAIAAGLGFAIGEMIFIAARVAAAPQFAALPWYNFGGFIAERLATAVWHPAFVALAAVALAKGWRWLPLGLLGAFVLHFIGNAPIHLANIGAFGIARETWPPILLAWVVLYTIPLGAMLFILRAGGGVKAAFAAAAEMACRHCGHRFKPGVMAVNLGAWRWARCPSCRRMTLS